jgi:hypothetical protein
MPILEIFMMRASPPSYAAMATLKQLRIPFKATEINYFEGEQFGEAHIKVFVSK